MSLKNRIQTIEHQVPQRTEKCECSICLMEVLGEAPIIEPTDSQIKKYMKDNKLCEGCLGHCCIIYSKKGFGAHMKREYTIPPIHMICSRKETIHEMEVMFRSKDL